MPQSQLQYSHRSPLTTNMHNLSIRILELPLNIVVLQANIKTTTSLLCFQTLPSPWDLCFDVTSGPWLKHPQTLMGMGHCCTLVSRMGGKLFLTKKEHTPDVLPGQLISYVEFICEYGTTSLERNSAETCLSEWIIWSFPFVCLLPGPVAGRC